MFLLVAGCVSSPNPSLDVASFKIIGTYTDSSGQTQLCGYGSGCILLEAVADGTRTGGGSCEAWATTPDGERLTTEPGWASGEFEIEPGDTYKWEGAVSIPQDARFRGDWDATCQPAPEG